MRLRLIGLISTLAFTSVLAGCGDDTTGPPPAVDPDTGAADTGTPRDTQPIDTGADEDTGSEEDTDIDSGMSETAIDAPIDVDAVIDSPVDAPVDTADAPVDAPDTRIDAPVDTGDTSVADSTTETGDASPDSADAADAPVVTLPAAEVWVTRVGNGTGALTNISAPVFIERYQLSSRTLLGTIPMPVAADGANKPLTFSGSATSEGVLNRSGNGRFVTLGGYAVAPGSMNVANSATTAVPRVIARVTAAGVVDTSTTTTSFSGGNIRGAASFDGTAYWSFGSVDGIQYLTHGSSAAGTLISTGVANVRYITLFENGALYGSTATGSLRVFNFGMAARPTTATTPAAPAGMSTTEPASPYGIAGISTSTTTDIDTIYVCDDAGTGGGITRYKATGGTFGAGVKLNGGLTTAGCRGLAVQESGTTVIIVAVTGENPSRVVAFLDTTAGLPAATAVTVATAAMNTQFRGPAFAPAP